MHEFEGGLLVCAIAVIIFLFGILAGNQGDEIMRDCEIAGVYIVNSENAIKCEVMK